MSRLIPLGPEIWHATHRFTVGFIPTSSRMTVVRLDGNKLWLHSPIPLDTMLLGELSALGEVSAVVAPNKVHHLFLAACAAAFPNATVYGAPGIAEKVTGLPPLQDLTHITLPEWSGQLDQIFIEGIPFANETVWFHRASSTLIVTDLLQFWEGEIPWSARLYARMTGVRHALNVPRTVRALVRDRHALGQSAAGILQWPIKRIVTAHNSVITVDAYDRACQALTPFLR